MIQTLIILLATLGVWFVCALVLDDGVRRAVTSLFVNRSSRLPERTQAAKPLEVFSITKYGNEWMVTTREGEQFVCTGGGLTSWYHYPSAQPVERDELRKQLRASLMAHIWNLQESGELPIGAAGYTASAPKPAPKPKKRTGEWGET